MVLERAHPEGLEKSFDKTDPDPFWSTSWLERGREISSYVCLIEVGHTGTGSGFLVGPDLVLTSFHVVQAVMDGVVPLDQLRFVFDHAEGADGKPMLPVHAKAAADGWCPVHSIVADLDFALVRLAVDLKRGFLSPDRQRPTENPPGLAIIQHPEGKLRCLAKGEKELPTQTPDGKRLRHLVPTDGGSSGSPVFAMRKWRLIGLHQGFTADEKHNLCVPIWLIANHSKVAEEISASLQRRPLEPLAPKVSLAHASALLRGSLFGERIKGLKFLRDARAADPTLDIPDDVVALLATQARVGTEDEQRATYETIKALRLGGAILDDAQRRWLDPTTPDTMVAVIATLFGDDRAGLQALYSLLEQAPVPTPHRLSSRLRRALELVRTHIQTGTDGHDRTRLLAIIDRLRGKNDSVNKALAELYYDLTGGLPDWYDPSTLPTKLILISSMVVAGGLIAFFAWRGISKKANADACSVDDKLFDPFDRGFPPTDTWCRGKHGACTAKDELGRSVSGQCEGGLPTGTWSGRDEKSRPLWRASLDEDRTERTAYRYVGDKVARLTRQRGRYEVECDGSSYVLKDDRATLVEGSRATFFGSWQANEPVGLWTELSNGKTVVHTFITKTMDAADFAVHVTNAHEALLACKPFVLPELSSYTKPVDITSGPLIPVPPVQPTLVPGRCTLKASGLSRATGKCSAECFSFGPNAKSLASDRAKALKCNDICDCAHTSACSRKSDGAVAHSEIAGCAKLDLGSGRAKGIIKAEHENSDPWHCTAVYWCGP